ncbi:hypothetical protein ABKN59_001911 [Abortiporus biennis]
MLELLRTYTGCPTTGLQHLVLPNETILLYPSNDCIIILNAHSLSFIRALAFWEAFPGALHSKESINRLSIDPNMKLIVASMGSRVATWAMSGVKSDTWRVHSSLNLPKNRQVTAIDCKSGLLAIGTLFSLSVYTLVLENDLPTWTLKWTLPVGHLSRIRFSPSLMYMASTSTNDNYVKVYLTTSGKQTQRIPHPRPVTDMNWRMSGATSRDDSILYTVTMDATLRIFLPVIDAPQHVQLHASLDIYSALPFSVASQATESSVFWLDREVISNVLTAALKRPIDSGEESRRRRIQEIQDEGWDLFLRVLSDGSLVVQAVANIDRRPPTLLKQFTLMQSPPRSLPCNPSHLYVLSNPSTPHTLTLITSPPITSYTLSPSSFFDAHSDGLVVAARGEELPRPGDAELGVEQRQIVRFERTADGEGVGAIRMDGAGETWSVGRNARRLISKGRWKLDEAGTAIDHLVVLEAGDIFITYSSSTQLLTLHSEPPYALSVEPLDALFSLPSSVYALRSTGSTTLVGVTRTQSVILFDLSLPSTAKPSGVPPLSVRSRTSLPLDSVPRMILPVDPMAWSGTYGLARSSVEHDVLLSVSEDGELAFWVPDESSGEEGWRCTGRVKTGRSKLSLARCSSAKKSVLVAPIGDDEEEITIWDSKESEFSSGLEYKHILNTTDKIQDLDWTSTPDNQSILAIGFAQRVDILCQQRMTYFDETLGWGLCWSIDQSNIIPQAISDSIWLKMGSLLIGAGHLMLLYGQPKPGIADTNQAESLFEHVARHNGPLDDYHPQMLLQCLLWEKIELVKSIIVNLANNLERTRNVHEWQNVPLEEFLEKDEVVKASHIHHKPQYTSLFSIPEDKEDSDDTQFSPALVKKVLDSLEEEPLPHLTPNEQQSLLVLIQTTLEIEQQRRALDANGLRYLITMRVFYIYNRRLSMPNTPASHGALSGTTQKRERLRYRDMIWAFHSESQDLLLSSSVASCENGKMCWLDARALGVFIWLRSTETIKTHMEVIARNQFLAGENRDPTRCSLFYFALGKVKLVHGLWRQASWHKEQNAMLNFLNNDFSQHRWRTAALKNAFALLSKRRFEYAAAFFLLGGSLKDAVNVCLKNLQDFQLAIALARAVEGDEGPILVDILKGTVIPTAFQEGNRWLASWAFWMLHRRDLAVRILITPLQDMATTLDVTVDKIGEQHYDDPSLALLFSELKSKTLQTAKGTSEISGRTEFNFVLQMARVFCRMGCHALALDIVRSWSFHRPSVVIPDGGVIRPPPSPITTRFVLEPALRRRASIMIDMDINSEPPTRPESPVKSPAPNGEPAAPEIKKLEEDGDFIARKAGIGSLMKSAKQDINVPEFDMNAFF